ncbi:MAG: DNA-binding transcriptional regulator [Verrucomicrobiota bacterium]
MRKSANKGKIRNVLMLLGSYDHRTHQGIAALARERHWHLDVSVLKSFQLPERWQGDGIITTLNSSHGLEAFIRRQRVPVVDLSSWRDDVDLPRVTADDRGIGKLAAEHYLRLGHRNFAWFALSVNPVGRRRMEGFQERIAEAGYPLQRLDGRGAANRAVVLKRIRSLSRPCAVFTKSDYDAAWFSGLVREAGLQIPEEVAVLGVDNSPLVCECVATPLSSVKHDFERIGYQGARLLDDLMSGKAVSAKKRLQLVPSEGVEVRQSTDYLAVSDPLIRQCMDLLQQSFAESISVDQLADQLAVSRRTLETRFRGAVQQSIREYLIQVRLQAGKRYLDEGQESVESIAALSGFCHASHFTATFKQKFGMTPGIYRRKVGSKT